MRFKMVPSTGEEYLYLNRTWSNSTSRKRWKPSMTAMRSLRSCEKVLQSQL